MDSEKLWSTIEPQTLVDKAYPDLVDTFKKSKIKPPKPSKRKKKQVDTENKDNTSITEPKPKKTRKTKKDAHKEIQEKAVVDLEDSFKELELGKSVKKKGATIENFFKKAIENSQRQKFLALSKGTEVDFDRNAMLTSTPAKPGNTAGTSEKCGNGVKTGMDWSSFYDEMDDEGDGADLSDIIEGIISRRPDFFKDRLKDFDIEFNEDFHSLENNDDGNDGKNDSSFFTNMPVENDIFEKTFNEIIQIESDEETEEYDVGEIDGIVEGNVEEEQYFDVQDRRTELGEIKDSAENEALCDSFLGNDIEIPLIERLKGKLN